MMWGKDCGRNLLVSVPSQVMEEGVINDLQGLTYL